MRKSFPVVLLALAGCGRAPEPLPAFNTVPNFVLTAQGGQEFPSEKFLAGKVWVADFIFTTCNGPCPRMSSQMRKIQEAVKDLPDVRLVSFTVDPGTDTPEVLAAYARRFQAREGHWFFLTGAEATLDQLNREAFMLGRVGQSMDHSTRFILIDRKGRVRGYYGSSDAEAMKKIEGDIRRLAAEKS